MPNCEASDEWQVAGVHWHAFTEARGRDGTAERIARRERTPDTVLRSPFEVARWIDEQTRRAVHHREVWAGQWVAIGDEDDLEHLRQENYGIAARGDSIFTDVYATSTQHNLYVEAVTDEQCRHGCSA